MLTTIIVFLILVVPVLILHHFDAKTTDLSRKTSR